MRYNSDMAELFSVLYLLAFILSGAGIGLALFRSTSFGMRCYLGAVIGLVLLCWLPAVYSFLFGAFSLSSQICAVVTAPVIAGILLIKYRPFLQLKKARFGIDICSLAAILPFFLLSVYLLHTHTIRDVNGALHVGQSTYGDLAMHLGFITSISEQKTFPPMYSICPDAKLCYPFLCDSVSSTFYTLGTSLRFAAMLPAAYALFLTITGAYLLFRVWLGDKRTALFSNILFFLGGGFGFAYFFDLSKSEPGKMSTLLHGFYKTPTNLIEKGIRWVNPIADMLIPQRATLFGWAVLFCCLILLYLAVFKGAKEFFPVIGILGGSLPLIHTHSFLALGVISAAWLMMKILQCIRHRAAWKELFPFLLYGLIACVIAAPQLIGFTFRQSDSFLRFHWNWGNETDNAIWFYVKNWGLLFILLPASLLTCGPEDRKVFAGPASLWFLSEIILFQPNAYDNNKLLFIVFLFVCGLIAKHVFWLGRQLRHNAQPLARIGTAFTISLMSFSMLISGVLTLIREAVSDYELVSLRDVQACEYIKQETPPNATFLTYNNHNNAVAMLTGRNIVCGSGTFLYFHGIDYSAREAALPPLFEQPETAMDLYRDRYHIDYVYVGGYERAGYDVDYRWFDENARCIYDRDNIRIYDLRQ